MTLNVFLKNGTNRLVEDFKEVKISYSGGNISVTPIDELCLVDSFTYHFIGTNTIVVRGVEIEHLELS